MLLRGISLGDVASRLYDLHKNFISKISIFDECENLYHTDSKIILLDEIYRIQDDIIVIIDENFILSDPNSKIKCAINRFAYILDMLNVILLWDTGINASTNRRSFIISNGSNGNYKITDVGKFFRSIFEERRRI